MLEDDQNDGIANAVRNYLEAFGSETIFDVRRKQCGCRMNCFQIFQYGAGVENRRSLSAIDA